MNPRPAVDGLEHASAATSCAPFGRQQLAGQPGEHEDVRFVHGVFHRKVFDLAVLYERLFMPPHTQSNLRVVGHMGCNEVMSFSFTSTHNGTDWKPVNKSWPLKQQETIFETAGFCEECPERLFLDLIAA